MNRPSIRAALGAAALAVALGACAGSPTQESAGQYLDSSVITARIQAELMRDRSVGSQNIRVHTVKGHVELSGLLTPPSA